MKYPISASEETYAKINLLGKPVLYTCYRLDRKTVPEGMYMYEVRHSDEGFEPCQIGEGIMVHFYGTIISTEPFELIPSKTTGNAYLNFDYETEWEYDSYGWSVATYCNSLLQISA